MSRYDAVNALIERQLGLVSLAQLQAHGVSESAIRWRLGRSWRLALPRVVQTFTGPLDDHRRLVAAALWAGPEAALTGSAAATWYGIKATARDPGYVFVTSRQRGSRTFGPLTVRRSVLVDPAVRQEGCLRVVSPSRAVVDAARRASHQGRADAIVIEAVQRNVASVPDLTHWLALGGRQGSARVRHALEAAATGVWSLPEAELMALLSRSRVLPEVWANPKLVSATGVRLLTPDLWVDEVALALMVHSRAHHFDVAEWEATVAGDSAYAQHGISVLAFTPRQIRQDPAAVRALVERTYLALRASRPALRARAIPRRILT